MSFKKTGIVGASPKLASRLAAEVNKALEGPGVKTPDRAISVFNKRNRRGARRENRTKAGARANPAATKPATTGALSQMMRELYRAALGQAS